jgi:cysteine-rich repeat protein
VAYIYCGDGILQRGEECDDGNNRDLDGCSAQCKLEKGYCGDGILQRGYGEQCDEGAQNGLQDSTCTLQCKVKVLPYCGDGVLNPDTEECDNGQYNGSFTNTTCLENCLLPYCGDGFVEADEQCDDGNQFDLDGCANNCVLETPAAPPPPPIIGQVTPPPPYIPTPAKTPTGPGLVIFLASGAAAGIGLVRRRMKV